MVHFVIGLPLDLCNYIYPQMVLNHWVGHQIALRAVGPYIGPIGVLGLTPIL